MATAGCSFALSRPSAPKGVKPTCEQSRTVPVLDLIGALGGLGLIVGGQIAFAAPETGDPGDGDLDVPRKISTLTGVVAGVVFGLAAIRGFNTVSACEEANKLFDESAPQQGAGTSLLP
jgi:hypothetical protein